MGELLKLRPDADSEDIDLGDLKMPETVEELIRLTQGEMLELPSWVDHDGARQNPYQQTHRPENRRQPAFYDGVWSVDPDTIDVDPFEGSR